MELPDFQCQNTEDSGLQVIIGYHDIKKYQICVSTVDANRVL